jgi:hypothetical protein
MQDMVVCNRPACFCFIDLEKSSDNFELNTVLDILEFNIVPNSLFILLKDIHVGNFIRIRSNGKHLRKMPIIEGPTWRFARPLLFDPVMNEIIKVIKNKKGYRMGNKEIIIIYHADDEVLLIADE